MSLSFHWAEELLTSTLLSDLTLQHIPFFSIPTARVEVFLICIYTLFWIVKTHDRAADIAVARLMQASIILPPVAVEVARTFLDGSFYVLLWVLIWGPTSGLAMFLRLALWCTIAALALCYFSATTPLNGFLWVPAWYYVVQPTCNALTRTARTLGSRTHRWTSPRAQSLLESMATVGAAATRSASVTVCAWVRRHRPTLGDLKNWTSSAAGALEAGLFWAACAFVDLCAGIWHSAVTACSQIASTSVNTSARVCVKTVAGLYAAESWATASIVLATRVGRHVVRRGFRVAVKTAAFFRKEPGTIECLVASAVQFLERLEIASEVLALVPFAVAHDGETLQMVPPQPFREAARIAVEVSSGVARSRCSVLTCLDRSPSSRPSALSATRQKPPFPVRLRLLILMNTTPSRLLKRISLTPSAPQVPLP